MARNWNSSHGSSAAELLLDYVRKHTWFAVANIFNDNGATVQPFVNRGMVCISTSYGAMFAPGRVDSENSPILDAEFLAPSPITMGFQQTISVFPLEDIQRFDCLLFNRADIYQYAGVAEDFPLPTIPDNATIMAMQKGEDGLYPGTDTVGLEDQVTVISTINLFPDKEWSYNQKYYSGLRVEGYQNFQKNHDLFCEAMNTFFGVSDCE